MWKIKNHKKQKGIKLNNTVFKKLNIQKSNIWRLEQINIKIGRYKYV